MNSTPVRKLEKDVRVTPGNPGAELTADPRERLQLFRRSLLTLHKALVEWERANYEQSVARISSPNHFLQLLASDPWFAWLRPMSQLIVAMDEALDKEEPLTMSDVEARVNHSRLLLVAPNGSDGFARHYLDALQRDPDVVLAHAEAVKLLDPRKRGG